ncbi:beta-tubulin cofactor d [Aaosphaeria arxii CBS 175.79]|uniref:Beta-tubulin cofactor d n=1 Tax=Aaosphaeria arxii CBS 175.79 TaxID=1450172 RepID=A0A6A5Y3Q7_9PLEO|nr:beta-tubulin cofactor d [Aaosphaeria arxii CBS 175.79]KAF2019909.1 beta-tubulin cofactor d [Aaosphaeria arxii CBS 175.79]
MDATDEEDLKLLRASASLLSDLESLLLSLVRRRSQDGTLGSIRQHVRTEDLSRVLSLIEPFQEDPQLLDTHLKRFVPPLVDAFLETLHARTRGKPKKRCIPLSHAICRILNLLCKVRGEKVIKGILNNEPRYLEPILQAFENGENFITADGEELPQWIIPWTERYVLLLWLSHLLLTPFPLASISATESSQEVATQYKIELPSEAPGITLRVIAICMKGLQSATKERSAAAQLLVRLCVRPDMQELGLLRSFVKWSLAFFTTMSEDSSDIHECLGILSFISGLVTSASNEEIGSFLPSVFRLCQQIMSQGTLSFVRSSAVARKVTLKVLRNVVVHAIQFSAMSSDLDTTTVLEETIELMLEALADGDTPVRYAASKGLSIITMKLDPEMAGEVAEALLGSFEENIYLQGTKRNLSAVDPLRWHGLTLTLSHLLYRKALSPSQLPAILNALLLALTFEQRSATGGSIGTNVRDAACFGIWALSRRYSTDELMSVDTASVQASVHHKSLSIPQVLAIELLTTACLDPAGNIRRGSSAALQELIGRHPNIVEEGITLVQIVDYHAVGLRERAMCEVAIKAGELRQIYWDVLFENLLTWRGTGSLDASSRESAAVAVGRMARSKSGEAIHHMSEEICANLKRLKPREIEERQGLLLSLSLLLKQATSLLAENQDSAKPPVDLTYLWSLLTGALNLEDKSFISPALRPEFTASSMCSFLGALAEHTSQVLYNEVEIPTQQVIRLLNLCLGRHEESVLEAIPKSAGCVLRMLSKASNSDGNLLVSDWLDRLENEASYNGLRCSGFAIALGAAYSATSSPELETLSEHQNRIINVLTFRCTVAVAIEARTVALKALGVLLSHAGTNSSSSVLPQKARDQVVNALHIALNDYTVTERGDVGSLVRLEALNTIDTAWTSGLLQGSNLEQSLRADVLRLSLEKLDKVRTRAALVLENSNDPLFHGIGAATLEGVSSYAYFAHALSIFTPSQPTEIKEALCLGFISSAGMGSESVVQNSRAALLDAIDRLPPPENDDADTLTFLDIATCFVDLLRKSLDNERTLLPILEVFAFLFDMRVMQSLAGTSFNFRTLLSLTQKSHFKSTHMQKLHLSLDVYRGLGDVAATREDTVKKVVGMLLHPFPKIRLTAAETLWILTREEGLKRHDWSLSTKSLKGVVEGIRGKVVSSGA